MEQNKYTSAAARPDTSHSVTLPAHSAPAIKPSMQHDTNSEELSLFDLDEHPELHYLSSGMHDDDDDNSSDSDDNEEDGDEWNAGITDFALFIRDRQQAKVSGRAIPQKWSHMLSNQTSALNRAVERSRQEALSRTSSTDSMPGLTPDGSPRLRDDLELASCPAPPVVPAYLKSAPRFSRLDTQQDADADDEEEGLSFFVQPRRTQSSSHIVRRPTTSKRPGLQDGRTLSGKEHVWQRPSWDMFTVKEDSVAERKAEIGSTSSQEGEQTSVRP